MFEVNKFFNEWAKLFQENTDYLTQLDSVAGDADLGIVMNDGFTSTAAFVNESEEKDVGKLFFQAGKHFNKVASSSMGTLLSSGFMNVGKTLKGKEMIDDNDISLIMGKIAEGVQNIGKAKEGEKTFLDAIFPAYRASVDCADVRRGCDDALRAAKDGVEKAKDMVAKHGRIAFRGEDSKGIIDPGTVVAVLLVEGIKNVVDEEK